MKKSYKLIGGLILALAMATAARAAVVTVSCNSTNSPANLILNSSSANLAAGAFVQVIDNTSGTVSAPSPATGAPLAGGSIANSGAATGTLSAPGIFAKSGVSIQTGHFIYIVAWETWNGSGTPTGKYGISAISPAMTGISYTYKPAGFTTSTNINPVITTSLTINTTSLPGGTAGTAYSQSLSASGGTSPYGWTISAGSLPAGLSLNSAGSISGTPATAGQSNFTVKASDSAAQTATQALTINVVTSTSPSASASVISVAPAASPTGTLIKIALVSGRSFGTTQGNSRLSFTNRSTQASDTSITTLFWSDTSIQAIVPPLTAGLYDIKVLFVQNSGGTLQQFESNPSGFQISGTFGSGAATIYPNPFSAGNGTVTIAVADTAGATTVGFYIFDRTARLVFKQALGGTNQTSWNGLDQNGNIVGDGAYLVRVVNEDTKALLAKGKLLVIKH